MQNIWCSRVRPVFRAKTMLSVWLIFFNRAGEITKEANITGYHNHSNEFKTISKDGVQDIPKSPFEKPQGPFIEELLLKNTDPEKASLNWMLLGYDGSAGSCWVDSEISQEVLKLLHIVNPLDHRWFRECWTLPISSKSRLSERHDELLRRTGRWSW